MHCHDNRKGDDDKLNGSKNHNWVVINWAKFDLYCYFRKPGFVSRPPPNIIKVAKLHGCRIIGNFFFDNDDSIILEEIIKNEENILKTSLALALLAKIEDFDGWFFNVEVDVKKELIPNLVKLVQMVTKEVKKAVPNGRGTVIWYDSVTKDGELRWQNCLNDKNEIFCKSSDGIFLNYWWSNLLST